MKDKEKQFRERVECGIAYCEDTAIEEIKQDFKMQEEKNKQIKEMMNDIKAIINTYYLRNKNCDEDRYIRDMAKILLEKYQPKLPEDSVVLSREEYEILTKDIEHPTDKVLKKLVVGKNILTEQVIEKTSKETAEKMLKEIYCKSVKHIKGKELSECFIELSFEQFDELARFIGVEIKE
jgi:transcriptional regulator of heat shock response